MVIFLLEISAGISIYAYRDKLLDGFGKGLNQSLDSYTTNPEKASDFDLMQSTVSLRHVKALVAGQTKTPPSLGRWQFKAMEIA
jgi:tetraspanin-7